MWNYFGQLHATVAQREDRQQGRKLPWVLPIVLYHGKREWKEATDWNEPWPRPQLRHGLVDMFRGPELDRSRLNVADKVLRLHRGESLKEATGEVRWRKRWLSGEEWGSSRRALIKWIMRVLVPWRLPGLSVADGRDLAEWTNWKRQ